jgi:DNA-directed RNA polymerase
MKKRLTASIYRRLNDEIGSKNRDLRFLKEAAVEDYVDVLISTTYLYTRQKTVRLASGVPFYQVVSAIGHKVRSALGLRRNSAAAAKAGAFLLYSFEDLGILHVSLGRGKKHNTYLVVIDDEEKLKKLWSQIPLDGRLEKLPSLKPYAPWTGFEHESGKRLVKTSSVEVINGMTPEACPIIYDMINRAQSVGWRINPAILKLEKWALKGKALAYSDIWDQPDPEARKTKLREANSIIGMAERLVDKVFYHLYYMDFRGRKYLSTAYLHEQGCDAARGLLLRADAKPIGEEGFFWLCVSIASNWAGDAGRSDGRKTDKLTLQERYNWVMANEMVLLDYAENPKKYDSWMQAEKPWQFIAACNELMKIRIYEMEHGNPYEYESSLEVFIDGSNNGSQHLSALTLDEITAKYVNLTNNELPEDLYKYVADSVWKRIERELRSYTQEERQACEEVIDKIIELKKKIMQADAASEKPQELAEALKMFRNKEQLLIALAAPVFWNRITDAKERRKIVKRNTMTIPYGGTAYGLSQQQIDDSKKHGIDLLLWMENRWATFMGREVYADCKESLKRPMRLLSVFEQAGQKAENEGAFLSWTVPLTNFPVVQHYTQGVVKKFWIQYGPPEGAKQSTGYYKNTFQVAITILEEQVPSKKKQVLGAAPNAIHSLDAAHLALTVHRADFPVTTVHDSYGCLLADMTKLFRLVRETFVELYAVDPLTHLLEDMRIVADIDRGSLNLHEVLESEYCFS